MQLFNRISTIFSQGYSNCNKGFKEKLKLQNRAEKIITRSSYEIRSADVLQKLGWATLKHKLTLK